MTTEAEPPHPKRSCGVFVAAIVVVTLVVFETLFFVFYVAPVVEKGNIQISAESIANDLVGQMERGFDCNTLQTSIASGLRSFPEPAVDPSTEKSNKTAITGLVIAVTLLVVFLIGWWFLFLSRRIKFPWAALAREALPLLAAFALYDFLFFQYFVRIWHTGSGDEFLYAMIEQVLHPQPLEAQF